MFDDDSVSNIAFVSLCHCYQRDADLPVLVGKTVLSHLHISTDEQTKVVCMLLICHCNLQDTLG